jgi:hypothetical protein
MELRKVFGLYDCYATEETFGFLRPRHQEKARMEDGCLVAESTLDACVGHGEHAREDASYQEARNDYTGTAGQQGNGGRPPPG